MIPNNAFTVSPIPGRFIEPYNLPVSPLSRACRGGIALNDASKGRNYQNWLVWYDSQAGIIYYGPQAVNLVAVGSYAVAGVTQVSLAFDNNMNPLLAWLDATGAHIRYFSGASSSYQIINVNGASSCLVCVDDARDFSNSISDAIFAYTMPTGLWYTYQRENYATARQASTSSKKLLRMGMNVGSRFQFETEP